MSMVAEGYYATKSAYILNNNKTENKAKTPIIKLSMAYYMKTKSLKKSLKNLQIN